MENHEIPHPRAISVHLILILLTNKECKHANASWMHLDIDAIIYTAKSLERLEGNQFQCTNVRKHCGYIQSIKKNTTSNAMTTISYSFKIFENLLWIKCIKLWLTKKASKKNKGKYVFLLELLDRQDHRGEKKRRKMLDFFSRVLETETIRLLFPNAAIKEPEMRDFPDTIQIKT